MKTKKSYNLCRGATMVEAAIALPLVIIVGFFLCELYFATIRYFVASDAFAIASRRLAIPFTVLIDQGNGEIPVCAELVEQTMRTKAIKASPGIEGLRVSVTQPSRDQLEFQASVQNECVVCKAAGVHFPITYSFSTIVHLPTEAVSCRAD